MKKIFVFLFFAGTFLVADLASINAHAQRAIRCTDSDNSTRNMSGEGPDTDRFVRGRTVGYSPSQRRRVARNDRCIDDRRLVEYFCMDDRMSGGVTVSCGENEFCRDGVCVTEIHRGDIGIYGERYLIQHSGQYVLNEDLSLQQYDTGIFIDASMAEVVLDCQGHKIFQSEIEDGFNGTGINVNVHFARSIVIKNCNLEGLGAAIEAYNFRNIRIENINVSKSWDGIVLGLAENQRATVQNVHILSSGEGLILTELWGGHLGVGSATITNTTSCYDRESSPEENEERFRGLYCLGGGVQTSGSGNHFTNVDGCNNGWPTPNDYSPCDEVQ